MLTALSLTVLTGFCFASLSMIVSRIAHHRISFFQFFTVSNLTASAAAWILLPDWSLFSSIGWCKVLLITAAVGLVNTMSQAAYVCSLKWGHNGLSAAIRNCASMISMFFALIFLHEKLRLINLSGVFLIILSLAVIAVFGKKNSISSQMKKWIPAVICSLLLSGTYQCLLTATVVLPESDRKAGIIIPCLLFFCGMGNVLASGIEYLCKKNDRTFFRFGSDVWKVLFCWSGVALLQYFLLIRALESMRGSGMASVAWPILICINVLVFSVFCRIKWKEKYPVTTIIGMAGCVAGLILIIWGRK
ncbi:MAG: EamA family transporter [Lentisphaeria bacterium]|nr:EamA family transporter [Lentisphaeria bacterium]